MNEQILQKKARTILTVGSIYMVIIGVLYVWSIIRDEIIATWEWTAVQGGLPFSVALACFATGNLIGGRLQVKISARIVGTLGGIMVGVGFILSGFIGDSPIMIVFSYGVVAGLGVGFGYCSFLPTALKWYDTNRKGFVSGCIIGGFGLTSLYLAPVTAILLNNFGLQNTFMILGISTIVISVPLAQFIKNPPENYVPTKPKNIKENTQARLIVDKTWIEMLKTKKFYVLFLMFLCSVSIGHMVIGNVTGIATLQAGITDPTILAGLVAYLAFSNVAGRLISGIISDKIGWANTLLLIFILHFINMLAFGSYNNLFLMVIGITLAGFCFGGTLSVYPAITVDQYGLTNYSSNYGIMYMAFGGAGIAAPVIASHFLDLTGNYNMVYIICAIGMVAMILTNFSIRHIIRKESK
jgi:MFS family permease